MNTHNPSKQRLVWYEADQQTRRTLMGAHLSKDLRSKHGTRALPLRVGDTVKIVRGDYKGKSGSITQVDVKRNKVFIQGFTHKKNDGKEAYVSFRPSNLELTALEGKDKRRTAANAKKAKAPKAAEGKKE